MDNKKIVQSEFWAKEERSCSRDEAENASRPEQVSQSLFEALNNWKNHANAVLTAHGFKPYPDGVPASVPFHIANGPVEVQDAFEVLQRIAGAGKKMKSQLSGVEVFDLAYAAILLGLAVGKAHVRPFEKPAASGRKSAKGGAFGGRTRRNQCRDRHSEWQRLAAQYWAKQPTASKRQVAVSIAKKTGDKAETIRKKLGRRGPLTQRIL
jgi:hypothetical protein